MKDTLNRQLGPICDTHLHIFGDRQKLPDFSDIAPLAQAFVTNNPERIVWGTDWPFLSHLDAVTYPQLMQLFESWVSDTANQRKILVDNPGKLFSF